MIILDTDICIEILRGNKKIIKRNADTSREVGVSFITVGELYYGAAKSQKPEQNNILVVKFLLTVHIIHSFPESMKQFGILKAKLEKEGFRLPDADLFIASTVLAVSGTLVTGNTKHFARIENLPIENWLI